ncbi:MAG: SMC family ATPase [Clostridia bacterium]|nr:SMC family ATPase [Clostridia bacterium]
MRPLEIKMSAFGPYAKEQILDLDALGNNGLYLITGDTGAGKTTIFDAIVYALYGEASGNNRASSMLRSKYADLETPTYVELTFVNREKTYTVKRNPEYERPAKKGGGTTKEKPSATLYLPDGSIISVQKQVDEKIIEIIGINRNQFLQIAMIAQGDFLKLLLASTDERRAIFRKIFKTEPYEALQKELSQMTSELESGCKGARQSIEQYISGISCDLDSKLYPLSVLAKNKEMLTDDVLALLKKIIAQDKEKESELKAKKNEVAKRFARANELYGKILEKEKARASLEQFKKDLPIEENKLCELEKIYKLARVDKDTIPDLNVKAEQLRNELKKHESRVAIKGQIDTFNLEIEKNSKRQSELEIEIKCAKDSYNKAKDESKSLEGALAEKQQLLARKRDEERSLEKINALLKDKEEIENLKKTLEYKQAEYEVLKVLEDEAVETYLKMNRAFLDAQAGLLAKELKSGQECPVCGSISHPKLANLSTNPPSETEINNQRELWQISQEKTKQKSEECSGIKAKLEEKNATLEKEMKAFDKSLDLSKTSTAEQISKIDLEIKLVDGKINRKEELEKNIPTLEKQITFLENEAKELLVKLETGKSSKRDGENKLVEIEKELTSKDQNEVSQLLKDISQKIIEIDSDYKAKEDSYNKRREATVQLKGKIEQLESLLNGDDEGVNLDDSRETIEGLKEEEGVLDKQEKEVNARLISNTQTLENIEKVAQSIEKKEKELMMVKSLSDTAKGDLTGKEKLALETYIQMNYFDRIIIRANRRLLAMTDGLYELKRRVDNSKARQVGLELDIIDHSNGSERSVKTLSGGESFKASLCLALGLSDEVQSSAGGIKLDTMFVDEGFGSLDEESLNQAIKALINLSDGNRLVGIISHVSELKARIDKQIIVKKSKHGGSAATIIV